ncbi:hypothetical protein OAC78_03480 [Litorivicinus sp.]|nr:hypothetical protein [Litorivicinus sp.]
MSLLVLTACSGSNPDKAALRDRQLDYQTATVDSKLKVPNDLSDERINEALLIPGSGQMNPGVYGGKFETPRVGTTRVSARRIQHYQVSAMQWLSISDDPSTVYPEIERFLVQNGLKISKAEQFNGIQLIQLSPFEGITDRSESRVIRYFSPGTGSITLEFSLEPGLRTGTTEVRLNSIGEKQLDAFLISRILGEFKYYLESIENGARTVSSSILLLETGSRISTLRIDGSNQLIIKAAIPRIYPVALDVLTDIGAEIISGDMNKGLLNIGYVDKATKLQLASMSLVNKAVLKVIDDGRAEYQLQMKETGDGVVLRVLSAGAGSSIIGVNELIAELQKRLF